MTYATDIKPVFDASCVKCHSGDKPKAKLKLDTLENALKGGKDGKVIVRRRQRQKPAWSVRRPCDRKTRIPGCRRPHNKANIGPLTPDQIGLIRAWIDQGAK